MILASDFDGTIYVDQKLNPKNLEFIKEFRKQGNLFGIVTGRDLYMTKLVIDQYQIPFDFIICNNGSVAYDVNYQVIFKTILNHEIYQKLLDEEILAKSFYKVISNAQGRFLIDDYDQKLIGNQYYTDIISKEIAYQLTDVYQVDTKYHSHEVMLDVTKNLQEKYDSKLKVHPNIKTIDLGPLDVNKYQGLLKVLKNYPQQDVITIGDGLNDLEMIENFSGYAMINGLDYVKQRASKVLDNFYDLKYELSEKE